MFITSALGGQEESRFEPRGISAEGGDLSEARLSEEPRKISSLTV